MSRKLFAKEDVLDKNQLLIDKVIEYSKKDESPLSLTADIFKERQELKKDIEKKLGTVEEEASDAPEDDSSSEDTEATPEEDNASDEPAEPSEEPSEEKKEEEPAEEEDDAAAADSKDSLKNLVGSATGGKKTEEKETATESIQLRTKSPLKPILVEYLKYNLALESYNIKSRISIEEQPVAYIKEAVIQSINNLISIGNRYIDNNNSFNVTAAEAIKKFNEEITVIETVVKNNKHKYTNKLVIDKDLFAMIAVPDKSDIRSTITILSKYSEVSAKLSIGLLETKFTDIPKILGTFDFRPTEEANGEYEYRDVLPGFNTVRVYVSPLPAYNKLNIDDYIICKLKAVTPDQLFKLDAIELSTDIDVKYILDSLDKLIVAISTSVENLQTVNASFNKYIDELKVLIHDIESDKVKDLAEIKMLDKMATVIVFKLVTELIYITVDMIEDYMSGVLVAVKSCIDLTAIKDVKTEEEA